MADKHTRRCLTPLIRDTQIRATMSCHLTSVRTAIVKKLTHNQCWRGCGEKGAFFRCWWEGTLMQPLRKTVWRFRKKPGIKPPYDPASPLLGTCPEETKTERDTRAPRLVAALPTVVRHGSNLGVHRQTSGWGSWGRYTQRGTTQPREERVRVSSDEAVNPDSDAQREVSQKETSKHRIVTHIRGTQKDGTMQLSAGQPRRHRHGEQTCGQGRGRRGRRR